MKSVFCLGVWDLFHFGHLELITRSAQLGELIVGVVCDEAVKKQKGGGRPIINHHHRAAIIKSLTQVSDTRLLNDFIIPEDVIQHFDIIVIGADQTHIKNINSIPKEKLHYLLRCEGVSTSDIINKIKES